MRYTDRRVKMHITCECRGEKEYQDWLCNHTALLSAPLLRHRPHPCHCSTPSSSSRFCCCKPHGLRSKNAHTTSCFVVFSFSSTTSAVNPALWNSSEHIFRGGGRMGYGYTASVIELSAEQRARKLQARPTLCATGKKPTKKSGQLRPAALSPYPYLSMPVWTKSTVV